MKKLKYSVVVPVFNEEGNVVSLHGEIVEVMKGLEKEYEIIFVNDGSEDGTQEKLLGLSPIKIIEFRKNCGQSAALDAGIEAARGEILITLDGDGQNDPLDIPGLLKRLSEGWEVVCGWRKRREDSAGKRLVSHVARVLRGVLVDDGVHDAGCTLRVYERACFKGLRLQGEMHRMIPALLKWRGFKVTEMPVNHRARKAGKTKYHSSRIFKGFLDMIGVWFWRRFEDRPMHFFGGLGLVLMGGSSFLLLVLAVARIFFEYHLSNRIWPLVGFSGFLAGLQALMFGVLASMVGRGKKQKGMVKSRVGI